MWQMSAGRYAARFASLQECLNELSPSSDEQMMPGEPVRLPGDSRDIPTVRMPYGDVPVLHASAGVQRVIGLAYLLVWAWHEHVANSELADRKPQRRIILMIDEVEAHLHPRWQRVIVPSLMRVVSKLASVTTSQIHLATHSPMVMASAETVFDEAKDDLHHLKLDGGKVILEELPFVKRGTADVWLMSEAFGLNQARSLPAEDVLRQAKSLQLEEEPDPNVIHEVHRRLVQLLAPDDDFWPRWRYFAEQHGGGSSGATNRPTAGTARVQHTSSRSREEVSTRNSEADNEAVSDEELLDASPPATPHRARRSLRI